ncbi:MAG: ABC transporter ATP-binding protein [Rhodothermales bacterium]|nr:ABC transporter ATP-binding protein [Rhodothermales bacterium]
MPPKPDIAAASPEPLVLERVVKRYGQGAPVLDGLSHTFAPGSATGLVGPNGSGKTTLLRLLTAQAYPTAGHVRYGALDVHAEPYRYLAHVGVVHDRPELPEALTAEELLEWVLRARGGWGTDAPARIAAQLDAVRLDERRAEPIGTYSSGMTRKAQLAAALVTAPAVLVLDEPFRGLDVESTEAAVALLRGFHRAGGTLLLATHRRPELEALVGEVLDLGAVGRRGATASASR